MTYSRLFGLRKPVVFILVAMFVDVVTTILLIRQVFWWAAFPVAAVYVWLVSECVRFLRRPRRRKLITSVVAYDLIAEGLVTAFLVAAVFGRGLS